MSKTEHDKQTIRCPRIGGDVVFKYCRACGNPFCRVIIHCWAPRMDIGTFLADNYTAEQIEISLARPTKNRLQTMLEYIPSGKDS